MMGQGSNRICVGKITAAHGLRGLVKIKPFTETTSAIANFAQLQDETGQRVALCIVGQQKTYIIAKIEGVSERLQADAWSGKLLYIMRSDLPELGPEDYYSADLIGLMAVTNDKGFVGVVSDVHDFGAGGILAIERENKHEFLVSFTSEMVLEVDMERSRVVLSATAIDGQESD